VDGEDVFLGRHSNDKIDVKEVAEPREKLIISKFGNLKQDENILDNFACAAKTSILLQGMLYVTNRAVYFYSPFNEKTLIGYGTKIKIEFEQI
jgi:hypothetical protein